MKFDLEFDDFDKFIDSLEKYAEGGLKDLLGEWLEAMGMEFLDVVQDEIIRTGTVDTRRLLNSFGRGDSDNIWMISKGGLTLEVGTNVEYASYANDGHWQRRRWVPGRWKGDRFEYDPSASTGMMLTERWVEGSHYWDYATAIFEKMFEKSLARMFDDWLRELFAL